MCVYGCDLCACTCMSVNWCRPTAFIMLASCSNHLPPTSVCVCVRDCKVTWGLLARFQRLAMKFILMWLEIKASMNFKTDSFTILLWWLDHCQTHFMPTNVHKKLPRWWPPCTPQPLLRECAASLNCRPSFPWQLDVDRLAQLYM